MLVVHHNDLDGRASAHVVAEFENLHNPKRFFEIDYGINFPFEMINKDEKVYILDYHIEPEEMTQLLQITENVIWIDHHISTVKKYEKFPQDVPGVRQVGISGCVLTYQYLYPDLDVPMYLKYVCDRDVWAFIFEDTKNFFSGSNLYNTNPLNFETWNIFKHKIERVIAAGETVEKYKFMHNKEYVEKYGYERTFEGHKAIIVNQGLCGSEVFDSVDGLPPLQILWAFDGNVFRVSLRSETIDVSKIALKFGGGGHAGASGFECENLPWE
jgi:oligoribonuclease NrnB/cAMP/cGMP phosphodiesterase (DHH superfamily)